MKTRPYGWPLMAEAWRGCVAFAAREPEMLGKFIAETGWKPARSPIELMIDEASGAKDAVWARFCDWVTVNVWGEEDGE